MFSVLGSGVSRKSRWTLVPSPSTRRRVSLTSVTVLERSVVAADSKFCAFAMDRVRTDSLSS